MPAILTPWKSITHSTACHPKKVCETWYQQTPENFRFTVKASRYLTHIKRLRNAQQSWNDFLERVLVLKEKLGPILLQWAKEINAFLRTRRDLYAYFNNDAGGCAARCPSAITKIAR